MFGSDADPAGVPPVLAVTIVRVDSKPLGGGSLGLLNRLRTFLEGNVLPLVIRAASSWGVQP